MILTRIRSWEQRENAASRVKEQCKRWQKRPASIINRVYWTPDDWRVTVEPSQVFLLTCHILSPGGCSKIWRIFEHYLEVLMAPLASSSRPLKNQKIRIGFKQHCRYMIWINIVRANACCFSNARRAENERDIVGANGMISTMRREQPDASHCKDLYAIVCSWRVSDSFKNICLILKLH